MTFTVSDGVSAQSATQQISVTAVNDAPTLTAPASYAATEQTTLNLVNTGLVVARCGRRCEQ